MAFDATTIWDVRGATGSDASGGGFSPLVTNMATDLAATSGNTASPVVTSVSYTFIARDVGHWVYVGAGTNWTPGWYQIASVNAGAATLSAAIGEAYLSDGAVPYSRNTAAGCATVASPTGGTWSVDYSQSTPIAFTDLVIDGTTNTDFTSAANPMGKNFIGNIFNVTSGTGFTVQRVQVLSIPSGVIARADKSMGTLGSTGGNATGGGPLATPGLVGGLSIGSNTRFIANEGGATPTKYLMTNSSNVAGGKITDGSSGTNTAPNIWCGWENNRHVLNEDTYYPELTANANSVTCFSSGVSHVIFRNINMGKNGTPTSVVGVSVTGLFSRVENSTANGMTGNGFAGSQATTKFRNVAAIGCVTGFSMGSSQLFNFVCKDCTSAGVVGVNAPIIENGVISGNAGNGVSLTNNGGTLRNLTIYGQTGASGTGVTLNGGFSNYLLENVISYGNAQENYDANGVLTAKLVNCAGGAGGAADDTVARQLQGFITLTEDPFIDAANGDFRLNDAAGGGALLKGKGFPQSYLGLDGVANFPNVGAYQSPTSSNSSGSIFTPEGPLGSGSNKNNQDTITINSGITALAGQLVVVLVSSDNESTTDGATDLHTSCVIDGHSAEKIDEFTNGQGSAGDGVTVSAWYLIAPANIDNGSAVVTTLTSAKTAKAVTSFLFDWDTTYTLTVNATATLAADAGQPGSLGVTPTVDVPYLLIRVAGGETSASNLGTPVPTSGWSLIPAAGTAGGADASNVSIFGEYKVVSGEVEQTSNPTAVSADWASIIIALGASLPGGGGGDVITRSTGALVGTDESTGVALAALATVSGTEKDVLGDDASKGELSAYAVFTAPANAVGAVVVTVTKRYVTGLATTAALKSQEFSVQVQPGANVVFLGYIKAARYMTGSVRSYVNDGLTNVSVLYDLEKTS